MRRWLDGARADVAPSLPSLAALASRGARAEVWVDLPSISAAQYVSLMSGVTPEDSGRRTNEEIGPVGLDTVASRVRAGGGHTAVSSDCVDWWPRLFAGDFDDARAQTGLDPAIELVRGGYAFTVVHLCAFDDAGHAAGAATEAYREAGRQIDRAIPRLLEAWADAGPVWVTADHGHVDAGGHGGDEPEVRHSFVIAAGPGIKLGGVDTGRLIDEAPTVAALMGVSAPASSEGHALTGLLELDPTARQALDDADRRRLAELREPTETRRATLRAHASNERMVRFGIAALLLAAVALWLRRDRPARAGLAFGALALALGALGYWLVLGRMSLSAHRSFGMLVLVCAGLGAAATFICVTVPSMVRARRGSAEDAAGFLLAGLLGAAPLAAATVVWFGLSAPRIDVGGSVALALPTVTNAALFGGAFIASLSQLSLWVLARRRTSSSR